MPRSRSEAPAWTIVEEELQSNRERECRVLTNSSDREHSADGDWAGEHEQTEQRSDCEDAPGCPDGSIRLAADATPIATAWESAVARVREDDSCRSDSAALSNEELRDDVQGEHRETCVSAKNLQAEGTKRLAVLASDDVGDVFDCVDDYEDDSPAQPET